jgi:hypothetical protein
MSLSVNNVWEDTQYSGNMNDTGESQTQFLRALNSTLNYLTSKTKDTFSKVNDIDGTIACDEWFHNAVYAGIKFYLQRQGAWAQDPDPESWQFFLTAVSEAIAGNIKDKGANFKTRNQPE